MILSGHVVGARTAGLVVILGLLGWAHPPASAQESFVEIMRFAADMAKRGNWREAKFRWEMAARVEPKNPKVLNNLAVADEVLGDHTSALERYSEAVSLMRGNTIVSTNLERASRFWSQVTEQGDGEVPTYDLRGAIPGDPEGVTKKKKGKSFKVMVSLPVPARLELPPQSRLLVISFLTDESHLLDINRELVRFIRSEYRKHTDLEVLPITPAPAVPEQSLEDLIANHEFWKYLGREYDAQVIVSGIMGYDRRDASGFRDVDMVSPTTGQKVRQSQFVEQERFKYELDIIFMDGETGELLFRDRLQRSALFRGTQNDPITAFFDLSDSIAPDVLAILKSRTREDIRFLFKK